MKSKYVTFSQLILIITLLAGCGGEFAYKRGATADDFKKQRKDCQSAGDEKALNQCLEQTGWAVLDQGDDDLFMTSSVDARNGRDSANELQAVEAQPTMKTSKTAEKPKPRKRSLLDTYIIKSWWKMGANGNALTDDMESCNAKLGKMHKPNKKTFTFTRGFVICMKENGWRALLEK